MQQIGRKMLQLEDSCSNTPLFKTHLVNSPGLLPPNPSTGKGRKQEEARTQDVPASYFQNTCLVREILVW